MAPGKVPDLMQGSGRSVHDSLCSGVLVAALLIGASNSAASAEAGEPVSANEILRTLDPDKRAGDGSRQTSIDLDIRFDFNSETLVADARQQLDELAGAMRMGTLAQSAFRIVGHTDASGRATNNMALSARRAAAVKRYLVERHGIAAGRLDAIGMGERQLRNPLSPEAAENRRVEVIAVGPFGAESENAAPRSKSRQRKITF